MTTARQLVDKLWSYCDVLRDDGVGVIEYTEQLTYHHVKYPTPRMQHVYNYTGMLYIYICYFTVTTMTLSA